MTTYTIDTLLITPTPQSWIDHALQHLPLLLVDHAHCEKKAASTAIGMIYRYTDQPALLKAMSKLAREEMRHFEQVLGWLEKKEWPYFHLTPGRYAGALHKHVRAHEPKKLVDSLILGAFIEARSCERFRSLAQVMEPDLAHFYNKLYLAEERHFLLYLELASQYGPDDLESRINYFAKIEADLVNEGDSEFRFHSGIPIPTQATQTLL